jgi:hypothetical protein
MGLTPSISRVPTSFFTNDKETPATPSEVLAARVNMARAWTQMQDRAYDALLCFGVNYRDGPAYKDRSLLEKAHQSPLARSVDLYIQWMGRVERDIASMIARKTFRKV